MVGIEPATAHKAQHIVDVAWVINQALEGRAGLIDLLVGDAAVLGVVLALYVSVPPPFGKRPGDLVDAGVACGNLVGAERAGKKDESLQVEEILLNGGGRWQIREADWLQLDMVIRIKRFHAKYPQCPLSPAGIRISRGIFRMGRGWLRSRPERTPYHETVLGAAGLPTETP